MNTSLKLLHHADNITAIRARSRNLRAPVMVDIDPVDGVCNLDCEWCCQAASRASRPATFMSTDTMNGIADLCQWWGVKAWRISGDSEPLLNKEINMLISAGAFHQIDMGLITNGVFLERVRPESLRALTYLGVSLDAATPATWARLKRSAPANFGKILNNVRYARSVAPNLDISLKFIAWAPSTSLHKEGFGDAALPIINQDVITDSSNVHEKEALVELAAKLGVRAIVKDAYPANMHETYKFTVCNATPLGGVFDASHKFHLCCDARNRFVLTDDYTRHNFKEVPNLWGSDKHWKLIDSIVPHKCMGCAKFKMNEVLQHVVMSPSADAQINFI